MISLKIIGVIENMPIPIQFEYAPEKDPYAVQMTFMPPAPQKPVVWVFCRDLLIEGLSKPVGLGDVKVLTGFTEIAILIEVKNKRALTKFKRSDIAEFVRRMTVACPEGYESEFINWDEEVKRLDI